MAAVNLPASPDDRIADRRLLDELELVGVSEGEPLYRFTVLLARCMSQVLGAAETASALAKGAHEVASSQVGAVGDDVRVDLRREIGAQAGAALRRVSRGALAAGVFAAAVLGIGLVGSGFALGRHATAADYAAASIAVSAALRSGPDDAQGWSRIVMLNRLGAAIAHGRCWDKSGGQACQIVVWVRAPEAQP